MTPNPHSWRVHIGRLLQVAALALFVAALGHAVLP
jgi:hypothetical protein